MTEKLSAERAEKCKRIGENIRRIKDDIAEEALSAGRKPENVRLMAVTKTVEPDQINHALSSGIDLIGENKVQEFLLKLDKLNLGGVEKHLIGHLQTNKIRSIIGFVDMIDSVDSLRLAAELSKQAEKQGLRAKILIEVNIGKEESKTGFMPEQLVESVHEISEMANISISGLMAIPPICDDSVKLQAYFYDMQKLFIDIGAKKLDNVRMDILSMGMSADYREAIREGSTMIRVGSAIFGSRI